MAREALLLGPSLTGVLTRMERDGLISRARCPQDARRTVVRATPAGLKLVASAVQTIEAHYAWMEERLGKARLAQLYALLDEVIALEQPMDCRGRPRPHSGTAHRWRHRCCTAAVPSARRRSRWQPARG